MLAFPWSPERRNRRFDSIEHRPGDLRGQPASGRKPSIYDTPSIGRKPATKTVRNRGSHVLQVDWFDAIRHLLKALWTWTERVFAGIPLPLLEVWGRGLPGWPDAGGLRIRWNHVPAGRALGCAGGGGPTARAGHLCPERESALYDEILTAAVTG